VQNVFRDSFLTPATDNLANELRNGAESFSLQEWHFDHTYLWNSVICCDSSISRGWSNPAAYAKKPFFTIALLPEKTPCNDMSFPTLIVRQSLQVTGAVVSFVSV
jgi:hypothetical protein